MKAFSRLLAIWIIPLALVSAVEGRICGTRYLEQHRETLPLPRVKLSGARQVEKIEVGTGLNFLVAINASLRAATCRYVGDHCYIFVEDMQWDTNGGSVDQKDVDTLGDLFENSTPADPERGIYDLEVEHFGPPPDVDGYERIFILLLDTDNLLATSDIDLIGFFDRQVATFPDPALRRDVIHLDARKLRERRHLALGTLAHEFQHLIHWGQDEDEEAWVNEGLSGYAEALTGFPETDSTIVPAFLAWPDFNLTVWPVEASAANYGATYLFMAFLGERYGEETIRSLVAQPRNGIFGVDAALKAAGWVQNFNGAWARWIVGNYAADDALHGYQALQGRRVKTFSTPPLPFEEAGGGVKQMWGTFNIVFRFPVGTPGNLAVDFAGDDEAGRYSVWGYAMRAGSGEAVELELDGDSQGHVEVAEVDSLAIIVGRTSLRGGTFKLSARELPDTAVRGEWAGLPLGLDLGTVYPNPFNGYALIPFQVPEATDLELSLYNSLGQRVRTLRQGMHESGTFTAAWDGLGDDGNEVSSGTYLVVLQSAERRLVQRLSLVR